MKNQVYKINTPLKQIQRKMIIMHALTNNITPVIMWKIMKNAYVGKV